MSCGRHRRQPADGIRRIVRAVAVLWAAMLLVAAPPAHADVPPDRHSAAQEAADRARTMSDLAAELLQLAKEQEEALSKAATDATPQPEPPEQPGDARPEDAHRLLPPGRSMAKISSIPKHLREIARAAMEAGWVVWLQGSGHIAFRGPQGEQVTVASSPSPGRAIDNELARLRRMGVPGSERRGNSQKQVAAPSPSPVVDEQMFRHAISAALEMPVSVAPDYLDELRTFLAQYRDAWQAVPPEVQDEILMEAIDDLRELVEALEEERQQPDDGSESSDAISVAPPDAQPPPHVAPGRCTPVQVEEFASAGPCPRTGEDRPRSACTPSGRPVVTAVQRAPECRGSTELFSPSYLCRNIGPLASAQPCPLPPPEQRCTPGNDSPQLQRSGDDAPGTSDAVCRHPALPEPGNAGRKAPGSGWPGASEGRQQDLCTPPPSPRAVLSTPPCPTDPPDEPRRRPLVATLWATQPRQALLPAPRVTLSLARGDEPDRSKLDPLLPRTPAAQAGTLLDRSLAADVTVDTAAAARPHDASEVTGAPAAAGTTAARGGDAETGAWTASGDEPQSAGETVPPVPQPVDETPRVTDGAEPRDDHELAAVVTDGRDHVVATEPELTIPEFQGRSDRPRDIEEAQCGVRRSREADWAQTQCHADEVAAEQERQRQDEEARRQREAEAAAAHSHEPVGSSYTPPRGGAGGYVSPPPSGGGGSAETWNSQDATPGPPPPPPPPPQPEPISGGDYCSSGVVDPGVCPTHAQRLA